MPKQIYPMKLLSTAPEMKGLLGFRGPARFFPRAHIFQAPLGKRDQLVDKEGEQVYKQDRNRNWNLLSRYKYENNYDRKMKGIVKNTLVSYILVAYEFLLRKTGFPIYQNWLYMLWIW